MIDVFAILSIMGQVDTATIEVFLYEDGSGVEHYDVPVVVQCFRDAKRRMVMDGSGAIGARGAQLLSEATVYLPIGTVCPVHSRVTLTDGAGPREVMQVLTRNGAGLPTPDHLEVLLT